MINNQYKQARHKEAKNKANNFVNLRAIFAYVLNAFIAVVLVLTSACSGDNKSTVSYSSHEMAIAERLYSHFYADEPVNTDDKSAEIIADEVLSIITTGQTPTGFDASTSEHKYKVQAIHELLYDSSWSGESATALTFASEVIENLNELLSPQENIPFIMNITTDGANQSFIFKTLRQADLTYRRMHYIVDCGNGEDTIEIKHINGIAPTTEVDHTCTYAEAGTYHITITQQLTVLPLGLPYLQITGGKSYFQGIKQWGSGHWLSMDFMFDNVPTDFTLPLHAPLTRQVQNLSYMFSNTALFNQPLSVWNVGNVKNMHAMFSRALYFNQNIRYWDVSSVTTMTYMFYNASAFNQNINSWDVSNVTNNNSIKDGSGLSSENCSWCP